MSLVPSTIMTNISLLQMLFDNFLEILRLLILIILFWVRCDVKFVDKIYTVPCHIWLVISRVEEKFWMVLHDLEDPNVVVKD